MPTIVEQLQLDAANPAIPVSTLLQRVKIAAAKLKLQQVESWVDLELGGYSGDVPDYRKVFGELRAFDPYHGWIEVQGDSRLMEIISQSSTQQAVNILEDLLRKDKGDIVIRMSPRKVELLNSFVKSDLSKYALFIGRGPIIEVLNKVRNSILDWAIDLERNGIIGEAFSFSPNEREIARNHPVTISIGNIGAFTGNMGSQNTSGDISSSDVKVDQAKGLIAQVQPVIDRVAPETHNPELTQDLFDQIRNELSTPNPEQRRLRSFLSAFRDALSGASGNLIATGIIAELTKLLAGS